MTLIHPRTKAILILGLFFILQVPSHYYFNGQYAVTVQKLKINQTQTVYQYNQHKKFYSASLYKLFLIAAYYDEFENKNLSPEMTFNLENGETCSLENALHWVAYASSENHSQSLVKFIGHQKIINQALKITHNQTLNKMPFYFSTHDIALFYQKLLKGQVVSPAASQSILALLQKNIVQSYLHQNMPAQAHLINKTGNFEGFIHDTGIVTYGKDRFIVVILSKGVHHQDYYLSHLTKNLPYQM
jgi:beta-lactamase class A